MAHLRAHTAQLPAGGGPFQLDRVTLGVFLNDQPSHHLSVGSDTRMAKPLSAQQGWLMPAGAEGVCSFDAPLDLLLVEIEARVLAEVGLDDPATVAPQVGGFDPLLLQMVLASEATMTADTLYRETMQRALAAHLVQSMQLVAPATPPLTDKRLARAVAYIHDHLDCDLRLEDMASEAAMSPYHFARAFKSATGTSPLQFVISARIETAQVLLRTTDLPVAEIAWRTGYSDVSRFGSHFRKRVGVTPGVYRNS